MDTVLATDGVGTVLLATNLNGHLKLDIKNSSLYTEGTTLVVGTNKFSYLNIIVKNCRITSKNLVASIGDPGR